MHLADHCNLNCFGCSHFSQVAQPKFPTLQTYEKDIKASSAITQGFIGKIQLMGGEPLLNPNCKDFFALTRKYFPNVPIWLVTNGVLLLKQNQEFWQSCRENAIEIHPTKYPINIDWGAIQRICKEQGVVLKFFMNSDKKQKVMTKMILNPKGNSNPFYSFIGCTLNQCAQLYDGKLYPCTFTAYIEHFNKHFSQNLQITPLDFIDIHKPNLTYQEILSFMAKPLPFCRYCDTMKWQHIGEWKTSKKDITEYLE
nr:radical SAM protein [Helicobacter rodentium]